MPELERVEVSSTRIIFEYPVGAQVATTLVETMCRHYKRIWDSIPMTFPDISFELRCDRPPKGVIVDGKLVRDPGGSIDCEPIIVNEGCRPNPYAAEVLENARRWGCDWVEEAETELRQAVQRCLPQPR